MSEKVTVKVERNILHLPAIALRGLVVFPNNLLHFEVGRDKSIAAVEWAVRNKSEVFLIAQKDMKAEDPKAEEMYQYGVVAEIKQVMRVSDALVRILVEGKFRAKRTELDTEGSFLLASVRPAPVRPIKAEEETEAEALLRNVKTSFDAVLSMNPRISKDVVFAVTSNNDPAFLCEYIPANLLFRFEDKQAVMEESTLIGRLRLLVERLHRERRMLEIDKENRRLSLGHKQLEENPWNEFENQYSVDSIHEGTITEMTDKGAVVALGENIEGFCPARQLTKEDGTTPKVGDKLDFKVIEFSKATKRITLSHLRTYEEAKRAEIAAEKAEKRAAADATKSTVKKINASVEKTTLGDIAGLAALKSAMEAAEAKNAKKAAKEEKAEE